MPWPEALLRAVVEVAPIRAAGLVRGGDEPHPRRGELLTRLGVLDRERDELSERGDAVLRAGRQGHAAGRADDERPPLRPSTMTGPATPSGGRDAASLPLRPLLRHRSCRLGTAARSPGSCRPSHGRRAFLYSSTGTCAPRPSGHDHRQLRIRHAHQIRCLCAEQAAGLLSHCREDLSRGGLARDENGQASQRLVLANDLLMRIGGRDCSSTGRLYRRGMGRRIPLATPLSRVATNVMRPVARIPDAQNPSAQPLVELTQPVVDVMDLPARSSCRSARSSSKTRSKVESMAVMWSSSRLSVHLPT